MARYVWAPKRIGVNRAPKFCVDIPRGEKNGGIGQTRTRSCSWIEKHLDGISVVVVEVGCCNKFFSDKLVERVRKAGGRTLQSYKLASCEGRRRGA